MADITPITMPKWGLSMREGKVIGWLAEEGQPIAVGDPLLDIETEKIANTFEALDAGLLRRCVVQPDEVLPVGALLGVLAPESVDDEAIDNYVREFQANYVPPPVEDAEAGTAYEWVDVDGYRLRYSRLGEGGAPVLLIHGFGGDLDNWLFNQQALAGAFRVYALDLPGHGQSTKQLSDASILGLARTVVRLMDALEVPAAHLVGHSMGGAIALTLADEAPQRVLSLSLLAPAGLGPEINRAYLEGFVAAGSRRDMKPLLQALVADAGLVNRQMIDDLLKYKRLDGVTAALSALAAELADEAGQRLDLRHRLATSRVPTQVIWGDRDAIIPVTQADALPATVRVHRLPAVGHLVQMEAAGRVNALLQDLWAAASG